MKSILYFGEDHPSSTSAHRADALRRLGHTVTFYNPAKATSPLLPASLWDALHFRTGYRLLQSSLVKWLGNILSNAAAVDLIWVDSGEHFGPDCLRLLKAVGCPVLLYNVDDPTGKRDGRRFDSLIKSLLQYDQIVVVRKETEQDCLDMGAKNVLRVYRSYDEVAHAPYASREDIPSEYRSEVAFIGTWMRGENRDEFLLKLISAGLPVNIWGNRWEKSPYYEVLKNHLRGPGLGGRDYIAAIQGAKICIGLLSKGNRDLHTQRSLEVPYAGGLFCAERTADHRELYVEDEEAVFWADAAECITVCKDLLANPEKAEQIRLAGMDKVRSLNVGNEDICQVILDTVFASESPFENHTLVLQA